MASPGQTLTPFTAQRRIIYADDMRELRDLMKVILERDGHAITCVNDGSQALTQLLNDTDAFDLVITDHHMPVMNGLEFVRRLRATAFSGKLIVFSSELSPEITAAYHRLQVDAVLPKPIYPHVLRSALARL